MADDASDYPAALDTFTTLPGLRDGPPTESDYHAKYQDALVNIETELGTNVRHRLGRTFADETARDAAITSPVLGDRAFLTNRSRGTFYSGAAWWPIPLVATGVPLVAFTSGVGAITFGVTFPTAPIVTASIMAPGPTFSGPWALHLDQPTTTGVAVYVWTGSSLGTLFTGNATVMYHAILGTFG